MGVVEFVVIEVVDVELAWGIEQDTMQIDDDAFAVEGFRADSVAFVVASPLPLAEEGIIGIIDEREGRTVGKEEWLGHEEYPRWGVRSGVKQA